MAKKLALLIGTDTYDEPELNHLNAPLSDVEGLKAVLLNPDICGFDDVTVLPNPSFEKAMRQINLLFLHSSKDDLLLLYFTGHGLKDRSGELYFAIKKTENNLLSGTAISASNIKEMMNQSYSRRQVLILDCCHSGAFAKGFKGSEAPVITDDTFDVQGYGRAILTASNAVQYAADANQSEGQEHSLFTHYLIEGLQTGADVIGCENISVNDLYDYAHQQVLKAQPNMTPNIFYDRREGRMVIAKNIQPTFCLSEDSLQALQDQNWRLRLSAVDELGKLATKGSGVEKKTALKTLKEHQKEERDIGVYQAITEVLNDTTSIDKPVLSGGKPVKNPPDKRKAGSIFQDTLKVGVKGPEMVVIPKGKFRMGDLEAGCEFEKPVHQVIIKHSFALSKYPVTFNDYAAFVKDQGVRQPDDEGWGQSNRPVIDVLWKEAVAYMQWMSVQTGKVYRLPSEAEWEYAARAGTETVYWWGDEIGVKNGNCEESGCEWSGIKTSPVDSFKANPFGLHDMLGNVWEWVQDTWHNNYEGAPEDGSVWEGEDRSLCVMRGGSWGFEPNNMRSASRYLNFQEIRSSVIGFRLAQDL